MIDDPQRCEEAGISKNEVVLKSKAALAIELVKSAQERGIRFNWVGADAGYGKDPAFLDALWKLGLVFVADVQKSQVIYAAPDKALNITVEEIGRLEKESLWKTATIRQSTKGPIKIDFLHYNAWIKSSHSSEFRQVRLLIQRHHETKDDFKYSTSFSCPKERCH